MDASQTALGAHLSRLGFVLLLLHAVGAGHGGGAYRVDPVTPLPATPRGWAAGRAGQG